jgi:CDP-ribitol ribitolphosphotransferase
MTVLFNSARLLNRCENLTAVWNAYDGDKIFKLGGYIDLVKTGNTNFNIVLTDEFVKNKAPNQKIIMIGHGLNGGKLYGADQSHGQFTPERCKLVDYYIATSEYGRKFAASAAGIPIEQCPALGMPRTDKYFGKKKGDGHTIMAQYKRAYLYLPTFRARYNKPTPQIDYEYLNSLLEEDEIFVVKRHMIRKRKFLSRPYTNIYEVDSNDTTYQYLFDCDVIVTDFSSALFDAYLLGKPSVLTANENDDYLISRGMYMNYPFDYSSRYVPIEGNEERLVLLMREAAANGMTSVEQRCCQLTSDACDGHSAERVVDLIKSLL